MPKDLNSLSPIPSSVDPNNVSAYSMGQSQKFYNIAQDPILSDPILGSLSSPVPLPEYQEGVTLPVADSTPYIQGSVATAEGGFNVDPVISALQQQGIQKEASEAQAIEESKTWLDRGKEGGARSRWREREGMSKQQKKKSRQQARSDWYFKKQGITFPGGNRDPAYI